MNALQTPAMDAPAAEWGAFAVSIPGYDWLPYMIDQNLNRYTGGGRYPAHYAVPNPDDPATAGCLLALLGWPHARLVGRVGGKPAYAITVLDSDNLTVQKARAWGLGRACIAAAAANGRWPGGAQ